MLKPEVSIVLSCYNEGPTLENSIQRVVSILKKQRWSWEIIFVEDKSTDETKKTVEKLTKKIPQSKAIFHKKNEGRGKSVADGIRKAKGAICGYLDVDLEVSADYIQIFISEIERGADMAVGERFYEGGLKSLGRFLASKGYASLVKMLLKIPIRDTEAGYKFFKKNKISLVEKYLSSEKIKDLIVAKNDSQKIMQQAVAEGMTTMMEDGLFKVQEGLTTIEEVLRATRE